ncbi:hypothetical protein D3C75_786720 [compost metagenome]
MNRTEIIENKVFESLYGKDTLPKIYSNSMVMDFEKEHPEQYQEILKEIEEEYEYCECGSEELTEIGGYCIHCFDGEEDDDL